MAEEIAFDENGRGYAQLTQVRVPLQNAADAFTQRDASGRIPIVIVPERLNRVRNEFIAAGLVIILAGVVAGVALENVAFLPVGLLAGLGLLVMGVYRSFMVRIPEGVNGLLIRGGRYQRTIASGTHFVQPWILVAYLATRREIPFDVPVIEAPTKDNVRASLDTLVTFSISDPYRFVYSIAADDFDQVFQAACQDALRTMVRQITSDQVVDLVGEDVTALKEALNTIVEAYGVTVSNIIITYAQPPADFMRSLEARQLAITQCAEQVEHQALAQRRQADAETLSLQEIIARVEREREQLQILIQQAETRRRVTELDAETDAFRLEQLEERLRSYPLAAQYEWESEQLGVASALAGNTRAVVQLGNAGDITRAFLMSDLMRLSDPLTGAARIDPQNVVDELPLPDGDGASDRQE
jgi:regulator of protease activity HflC (stomatin/prohibitin superfamily)